MAIGKSEARAEIVVTPRDIIPDRAFHAEGEGGVVEALEVFVHENPEIGWAGVDGAGAFAISQPR